MFVFSRKFRIRVLKIFGEIKKYLRFGFHIYFSITNSYILRAVYCKSLNMGGESTVFGPPPPLETFERQVIFFFLEISRINFVWLTPPSQSIHLHYRKTDLKHNREFLNWFWKFRFCYNLLFILNHNKQFLPV